MSSLRPIRLAWLAAALLPAACSDVISPDLPVESVQIVTTQRSLSENDTLTFTARALSSGGAVVEGRTAVWTSSDPQVVTITAAGHATARAVGIATLRATAAGRTATAQVVVNYAPVGQLVVAPAALSLVQYEGRELTATARDTAGRPITGRVPNWRSLDTTIVKVDAMGRVIAQGVGTTTVEVGMGEVTRSVPVTVAATEIASVTAGPAPIVQHVGGYAQLIAIVRDTAGRSLIGFPRVWTTDAPQVATVNHVGMIGAVGPGYATITVTAGGKSFSVAVTISNGEADAMPADLVYHRATAESAGEIMIASTATDGAPVALSLPIAARDAAPSPDGSRIAFTSVTTRDIYVVDRDGGNLTRLTDDPANEGHPAWSPDGQRIAYRHETADGRSTIQVMNADGSGKVSLTTDLADTLGAASPAWSPDGARIAFATRSSTASAPMGAIWSMKADGTDKVRHVAAYAGWAEPAWSPDGQRIAFTGAAGDGGDIVILTLATGAFQYLGLPGAQASPSWSPDGQHLAFSQPLGENGTAIYTVRKDGSNMRLRTTNPAWGGGHRPRWIDR